MKRLLVLAIACGDPAVPVDAAIPCDATFSGNFGASTTLPTCATLAGGALTVTVATDALATPLVVTIALPSPSPGAYSPVSVPDWSATATRDVFGGTCSYSAGATAVPAGTFALALTDLAPHGTLDVTTYVLSFPACGSGETEATSIRF